MINKSVSQIEGSYDYFIIQLKYKRKLNYRSERNGSTWVFEKAKEKYPDKEISIAYIPTDEEMVTNIIGRLDIFDRFKICFDESEKIVEFYPKVSKLEWHQKAAEWAEE